MIIDVQESAAAGNSKWGLGTTSEHSWQAYHACTRMHLMQPPDSRNKQQARTVQKWGLGSLLTESACLASHTFAVSGAPAAVLVL